MEFDVKINFRSIRCLHCGSREFRGGECARCGARYNAGMRFAEQIAPPTRGFEFEDCTACRGQGIAINQWIEGADAETCTMCGGTGCIKVWSATIPDPVAKPPGSCTRGRFRTLEVDDDD